jgi:predicted RNase H-related nuclease YkuK (DUF458 family)
MIPFDFDTIRKEISASADDSSVYIGADSKVYSHKGEPMVAYVTVIILHHGSSKGAKIFRSHRTDRYYGQIRSRLMAEVTDAILAGTEIADVIGDRGFEIHLDINRDERYKSSALVKEATGYVLGTMGFEPKLKPDSFAASSVADRYCVKDARKQSDSPAQKRKHRVKLNLTRNTPR